MENRRQAALQRKADEEKAKTQDEERRLKEESERRKKDREEHTDKRPLLKSVGAKKVRCTAASLFTPLNVRLVGGRYWKEAQDSRDGQEARAEEAYAEIHPCRLDQFETFFQASSCKAAVCVGVVGDIQYRIHQQNRRRRRSQIEHASGQGETAHQEHGAR